MRGFLLSTLLLIAPASAVAQTTQPAAPGAQAVGDTLVVAADGSGEYTTVQAAVDAVPKKSATRHTILIKPGTYRERVKVGKDVTNVTFRGDADDPAKVVIVYNFRNGMVDPATGQKVGTSGSETVLVEGDGFTAEKVTFENDAGDNGQAVAIRTRGDKAVFRHCRFVGWQDTLYANGGRHYFADCHIEGRVDFIFGRATAVFERCTIVSKNGGFVTAASTPAESKHGYVFLNCKLTSADNVPTYLGRPWKPDASVAFVRCELGAHIRPEGWDNWGKAENEKTARYAEFGNTGPGANTSKRVPWAKQLTAAEAAELTPAKVLAGTDGWNPATP
jgi:pectinesterase